MKSIIGILFIALTVQAMAQERFDIRVQRSTAQGNLLKGNLYVNEKYLGETFENDQLKIQPGEYSVIMRYISTNGHVTGPLGSISHTGDFLLEVDNVLWSDGRRRSDILFHGGNKPHLSTGCIMLGAVPKDADGNRFLPENHTLSLLRKEFYGTDLPNSSPNKVVTLVIE